MTDGSDEDVHFVEPDLLDLGPEDILEAGPSSQVQRWTMHGAVALVTIVVAVIAWRDLTHGPSAPPSQVTAPKIRVSTTMRQPPFAPSPLPAASLRTTLQLAVAQICTTATPCTVRANARGPVLRAHHALGPLRELEVRDIDKHRARIVAAATSDGGELIALAVHRNVKIDPALLRLPSPVGAQYQFNARTRLVVVVTGTPDVVALLARSKVQNWLAELTA